MSAFMRFEAIPRQAYGLIVADPPWRFRNWSAKGERKSPQRHYACLSQRELEAWPVADLATPDAVLWLWATNPMLPQALALLAAWDFRFVTAGHWVKRTARGKLAFGTGYCLRAAGEPFLIGARGRPRYARTVRSVIEGPQRAHSRKPEEAYAAAAALVPSAERRLELFGREERPGWDVFGNQIGIFEEDKSDA